MTRMARRRERRRAARSSPFRVGLVALVVSLAVHAGLLVVLAWLGAGAPPERPPMPVVALAPLTASDWEANRAIQGERRAPVARPPAPPPPAAPEPPLRGPVVEVPADAPRTADQAHPKDQQVFLGDRDSFAKKNTVSRNADVRNKNNLSKPQGGRLADGAAAAAGEGGIAPKSAPGKAGPAGQGGQNAARPELPSQAQRQRVALAPAPGGVGDVASREGADALKGEGERLALPGLPGTPESAQRAAGDPRLKPSQAALERIAGGPMMGLEGVEQGDETLLNAREFKYATFFTRLYRAVGEQWNPERAYTLRDPDGSTYPARAWRTRVHIRLDPDGQVKDLRVVSASGLDFLDQEAVRAVRAAAPFPNPPAAVVKDGEIDLGVWSFTYTTSITARPPFGHMR
jgi:TonB family protein